MRSAEVLGPGDPPEKQGAGRELNEGVHSCVRVVARDGIQLRAHREARADSLRAVGVVARATDAVGTATPTR